MVRCAGGGRAGEAKPQLNHHLPNLLDILSLSTEAVSIYFSSSLSFTYKSVFFFLLNLLFRIHGYVVEVLSSTWWPLHPTKFEFNFQTFSSTV